jgi:hypothetical protein
MKRTLFVMLLLSVAKVASAYEFHLQYTAPSNARNLAVVGDKFASSTPSWEIAAIQSHRRVQAADAIP